MNEEIAVLLVDDEPSVADLAATHLERLHDDIAVAVEDGVEAALARFERDPEAVDCIVSDYTMPGMNGLEFLSAVRDSHSDVPFVLFTGKGSEEIASEAVSAGVTDYLQKGTGTEQYELLANRIDNAVEAHRAEERVAELARINGVITDVQRELVRQSTREDIEGAVCARLAESASYTLAWVGEPDSDAEFVARARAGAGTEYLDEIAIRTDDTPRGRGPAGTAFRTGDVQAMQNIAESADFEPWQEAVARHGHESIIVLPLTYEATDYGVLAVYSNRRYAFGDDEREGLAELANTVARAIHAAETRARLERRERALAESERKYRSLIDTAPDAVLVADADTGDIVEANNAAETLLDRSREELVGLHQSDLHPAGEAERYRDLFERHVRSAGGDIARFGDGSDVFVVRPDGERVPVEINASTAEIDGRVVVHAVMRDVSARRERERALHEERGVTAGVFEALPDPVYAFDSDGWMLRWNDEFESVVGYSGDEIADMNCLEFVPPEDRDPIADRIEAVVENDEHVTVESAFVTKSGATIPHEFSGARLTTGETVRGVIGTGRDITERNEREMAVSALHGATRDLVSAEDSAGVARVAAAAAEEVLGFPISVVRLLDDETDALEPVAVTDATERILGERFPHDRDEGIPWRALRAGEPVVTGESPPADDDFPACHQLYVPIGDHGTLSIATPTDTIDDTDIRLARMLAANAAVALDRVERETQLQRYQRMLDTAGDSVYTLDEEGRFTAFNRELVERTGYAREELLGEHVSLVLDDADVERGESLVVDLLSREDYESSSESYEMTVRTADGDTIPCETKIALLETTEGFEGTVGVTRDIATRKERERDLEAARSRFRALAENTTLGVVTIDGESTVTYANDAVEDVFGYPSEELVGGSLTTVMPERYHDAHFAGIGRYLSEGTKNLDWEWIELPGEHRDGHEMDLGVSFGEHVTEDEHRFTATIRDITEQKRHERAIAGLHGATRDLVGAESREGVAKAATAAAEDILDFPVTTVRLYDPETDALEPAAMTDATERILGERPTYERGEGFPWQAFESGESVVADTAALGDGIPVRHRLYVPIDGHGTLSIAADAEAGAFNDTDIQLAEVLAANAGAALDRLERERELERYETIIETINDAVYTLDDEGRFTFVNDAFGELVGHEPATMAGTGVSLVKDDETVEMFEDVLRGMLSNGVDETTVEFEIATADGDRIPCEDHLTLRRPDGEFRGVAGAIRDVTERKRHEEALESLHDATREMMGGTRTDVAETAVETVEDVLDLPMSGVWLADDAGDRLEPAAVSEMGRELFDSVPAYTDGGSLSWQAFERSEVRRYDHVEREDAALNPETPVGSEIIVPLGDHGVLNIGSPAPEAFSDRDVSLAKLLGTNVEAALNRAERETQLHRYERMLDTAGDGIYALDAEGRYTAVNDRFVANTGYSRGEILGEHVSLTLDAEDIERGKALIRDLLSAGTDASESYEMTTHTADGGAFPSEARITPLYADGVFEGTVGVVRDITDRKRHEGRLESLHDATREMMDATTQTEVAEVAVGTAERVLDMPVNGVWLADENGKRLRPVAQSARSEELFGTPPTYTDGGDSLGWEAFENGELHKYDRVDREEQVHNPETPLRSEILVPLGEYGVLTAASTRPGQFDESDVSLSKLLAANTEAALNRAEREHQLVVEHDRLTALFENVPDAAVSYELVGGKPMVRSVNSQFETVFGYSGETVRGENIDEYIIPAERETEAEEFNEALLRGNPLQTTVRRRTADGVRDFLLHVVPLELGERNVEGYSIYTDITDQKRRERELERQNELLDGFASVISHDLRNPMSVARGRVELAQTEAPSDHHDDALWALDRMDALIEDVLTLARQGKVIGETERVSLADAAETAWRTAGTETAALALHDPGAVEADEGRLARLFENLFRNATEHAGADAAVTVGGFDGGFFVADDGPGIPTDERESVFEHGYTTTDSGTGLGLMIVRSIAEAHDWTVRVTESEAGGARFEIRT